jgi:hypothetical protein
MKAAQVHTSNWCTSSTNGINESKLNERSTNAPSMVHQSKFIKAPPALPARRCSHCRAARSTLAVRATETAQSAIKRCVSEPRTCAPRCAIQVDDNQLGKMQVIMRGKTRGEACVLEGCLYMLHMRDLGTTLHERVSESQSPRTSN